MSEPSNVLFQDIDAILRAFEKEDYNLMNIYSNRFISNAVFHKKVSLLPGFIYKDISMDFRRLKDLRTDTLSTAKVDCKPILEKIRDYYLDSKKESIDLWGVYLEYYLKIRDYMLNDIDKKVYKIDYNYTQHSYKWLLNFLDENKNFLLNKKNRLLQGVLNEMDRIMRCHSGRLNNIVIISLIKALNFLNIYIQYEDSDKEKEKFLSLVNNVINILSKDKIDFEECLKNLENILIEWRKYFIRFMDIVIVNEMQFEKPIELPEEVKMKISESISKTLGEEIT